MSITELRIIRPDTEGPSVEAEHAAQRNLAAAASALAAAPYSSLAPVDDNRAYRDAHRAGVQAGSDLWAAREYRMMLMTGPGWHEVYRWSVMWHMVSDAAGHGVIPAHKLRIPEEARHQSPEAECALVTEAEIRGALAVWDADDEGIHSRMVDAATEGVRSARIVAQRESGWGRWVAFLRAASARGGFAVMAGAHPEI